MPCADRRALPSVPPLREHGAPPRNLCHGFVQRPFACSKHHAVYVAGVNGALSKHPEFEKLDIVAVLKQATDMPADIKTAVRNHGAARTHAVYILWHGRKADPAK